MSDLESGGERRVQSGNNGPSIFLILMLVVAAIVAIFIFQNRETATITFLFFDGEFRVWTAIAIAILLGVLLDRVVLMWWRRARRRDRDDD